MLFRFLTSLFSGIPRCGLVNHIGGFCCHNIFFGDGVVQNGTPCFLMILKPGERKFFYSVLRVIARSSAHHMAISRIFRLLFVLLATNKSGC